MCCRACLKEVHWVQNNVPELFSLSNNPSYQLSLLKGVGLYVADAFMLCSVFILARLMKL